MPINSATTLLAIASNHGIINSVVRHTGGTNAGGLRVFECEAQPFNSGIPAAVGDSMVIPLNENYGCAGAVYADFLVRNKAGIAQIVGAVRDQLQQACSFKADERFWMNTMVTIIAGAHVANASGLTSFNVPAIEAYLCDALRDLRGGILAQSYTMAGPQAGEEILAEMTADLRGHQLVHTDIVPVQQRGRPTAVVTAVAEPFMDPARMGDVWMQIGKQDGRVLARVRPFNTWLIKHGHHPEQVIKVLRQDYDIVQRRASIGAGVPWLEAAQYRAECWDMTPKTAPSHNPSSPFSSFGSPVV